MVADLVQKKKKKKKNHIAAYALGWMRILQFQACNKKFAILILKTVFY